MCVHMCVLQNMQVYRYLGGNLVAFLFGAHFPRPAPVGCGRAGRPPARGWPSITPRRVTAAAGALPVALPGLGNRVPYMGSY